VIEKLKSGVRYLKLPADAKAVYGSDKKGPADVDPGTKRIIQETARWLARAQDMTASHDGGVARDFSLIAGWVPALPCPTDSAACPAPQCAETR
jgi:hypothetical protein